MPHRGKKYQEVVKLVDREQLYTPEELTATEEELIKRLAEIQVAPAQRREKGFWSKVKESLGA